MIKVIKIERNLFQSIETNIVKIYNFYFIKKERFIIQEHNLPGHPNRKILVIYEINQIIKKY